MKLAAVILAGASALAQQPAVTAQRAPRFVIDHIPLAVGDPEDAVRLALCEKHHCHPTPEGILIIESPQSRAEIGQVTFSGGHLRTAHKVIYFSRDAAAVGTARAIFLSLAEMNDANELPPAVTVSTMDPSPAEHIQTVSFRFFGGHKLRLWIQDAMFDGEHVVEAEVSEEIVTEPLARTQQQ